MIASRKGDILTLKIKLHWQSHIHYQSQVVSGNCFLHQASRMGQEQTSGASELLQPISSTTALWSDAFSCWHFTVTCRPGAYKEELSRTPGTRSPHRSFQRPVSLAPLSIALLELQELVQPSWPEVSTSCFLSSLWLLDFKH